MVCKPDFFRTDTCFAKRHYYVGKFLAKGQFLSGSGCHNKHFQNIFLKNDEDQGCFGNAFMI